MKKKQITKFFFLLLYFCHVILLFLPRYNENFYSEIISIMINRNNIHLQSYFLHHTYLLHHTSNILLLYHYSLFKIGNDKW